MENGKVTFESTLKSSDTEEIIDIYFYRPIGFRIALFCRYLGITPNPVPIASIFIGVAAGILFYYENFTLSVIGIGLLIFANSLDASSHASHAGISQFGSEGYSLSLIRHPR